MKLNFAHYFGTKHLIGVGNASGFSFYPENNNKILSFSISPVITDEEVGFVIATLNKY